MIRIVTAVTAGIVTLTAAFALVFSTVLASFSCSNPLPGAPGLDAAACTNAAIIISTIEKAGLKADQLTRASVDAIASSLQETGGSLHNIPYGDRDSLGLFQQRPSQGWGTPAEVMDPVHATQAFLSRLLAVPGWLSLPVGVAAQAVQRSVDAAGELFQRWASEATAIVQDILNAAAHGPAVIANLFPGNPFGGACHPVVTQPWGVTTLLGEPVLGGVLFHTGIDLACPVGTPVVSVTDGIVYSVVAGCVAGNRKCGGGYGNNVDIRVVAKLPGDLNPAPYFIRYAHLESVSALPGAVVQAGQQIGREGMTGFATGPHVHFEVDRLQPIYQDTVDPTSWLRLG